MSKKSSAFNSINFREFIQNLEELRKISIKIEKIAITYLSYSDQKAWDSWSTIEEKIKIIKVWTATKK